jgi:hypothetical protein
LSCGSRSSSNPSTTTKKEASSLSFASHWAVQRKAPSLHFWMCQHALLDCKLCGQSCCIFTKPSSFITNFVRLIRIPQT